MLAIKVRGVAKNYDQVCAAVNVTFLSLFALVMGMKPRWKTLINSILALGITIFAIFYVAPFLGLENPFARSIGLITSAKYMLAMVAIAAAFFYLTDRYAERFEG